MIGPTRGGRALTATGVPGQPNVFYFGAVGGGVWETTDAGRVWKPIFDHEPVASIGAVAVAPSNPNVIYVGSGEADMRSDISYGNGMYKSTDAGKTWEYLGLPDSRQIGRILVDPHHPDVLFVAVLGHAYGPNLQRGVFRSADGGKTWKKVLYKDENTGAIDLAFDPQNPQTIYAALWQTRRPPWNVYPPSNGPGSGLYKSTDGGNTWTHLSGHGLPSQGLGRIGIAVAPADPNRVYLIVDARQGGLYRSDDAGETWKLINTESRIWGRGWYFSGVTADPKDENTVYVANTSLYRSRDGGKSFTAIKGAPGGDDYHSLWIDPSDSNRMVLASDQGVVISVDGASRWTSWYNQATAQIYHVVTDDGFPYWVYGAQQDSGAVAVPSRSTHAGISFRDWHPIEVGGESEYIAADPLHANVLFGGSYGDSILRYNFVNKQTQNISPTLGHPGVYRSTWTLPLVFDPRNPNVLYYGTQVLFQTSNGGQTWNIISPDLTRVEPATLPNLDPATEADDAVSGPRRGVIYTIAPSRVKEGDIWIGTDDGLIQVTHDRGRTWKNVTPAELTAWSKVAMLEASPFDANTVYAAVDRHRLDDLKPYIYRTHDGGETWQKITNGIPDGSYLQVVREDPIRRGLLFAGTETGVFVSFDDGDHWQSLQLNLPNCSVRDLALHGNDLVAATHGRSFWILDDISPLRQIDSQVAQAQTWLFKPATAFRIRPGSDEGTPLPVETASGKNPPDGAIIYYYLKTRPRGPLVLEIHDEKGNLVRRYSSTDHASKVDPSKLDIPAFWVHPPQPPSAEPGMHRFVWNLRYASASAPRNPYDPFFASGGGPWAPPAFYAIKMTVDGQTQSQPFALKLDPRVKTSDLDLQRQFELASRINQALAQGSAAQRAATALQAKLKQVQFSPRFTGKLAEAANALTQKVNAILGGRSASNPDFSGVEGPSTDQSSLRDATAALGRLEFAVESADVAPTPDYEYAFKLDQNLLQKNLDAWRQIEQQDLPQLNLMLVKNHLPEIKLPEAGKGEEK
ncbi:MAG: WD40/YVTN/BNR-like repeat-containing protein [Terriglobia bacterium]